MIGVELMISGITLALLVWMIGGFIPSQGTEACVLNWMGPGLIALGVIVVICGIRISADDDH